MLRMSLSQLSQVTNIFVTIIILISNYSIAPLDLHNSSASGGSPGLDASSAAAFHYHQQQQQQHPHLQQQQAHYPFKPFDYSAAAAAAASTITTTSSSGTGSSMVDGMMSFGLQDSLSRMTSMTNSISPPQAHVAAGIVPGM